MPHSCPMHSATWGNSTRTSDNGSCDLTLLVSVVGVTDRVRLAELPGPVVVASGPPGRRATLGRGRAALRNFPCQRRSLLETPLDHREGIPSPADPQVLSIASGRAPGSAGHTFRV